MTSQATIPADQDERAKLIESAVDFIHAKTFKARGLHIYKADETGERHIVTDDAMAKLGRMLAAKTPDVYAEWCHVSTIIEVDVEGIVHDSSIGEDTDLDALQAEAGAADDMATFMMLEFHREEIEIEAARVAHDRREDEGN